MEKNLRIAQIIAKSKISDLSHEEQVLLDKWLNSSLKNKSLYEEISDDQSRESALRLIQKFNKKQKNIQMSWQKNQMVIFRRSFVKIASIAAILIFAIVSGLYFIQNTDKTTPVLSNKISIPSGQTGAILTLASGEKLVLNKLSKDSIHLSKEKQEIAVIANNQLIYNQTAPKLAIKNKAETLVFNTLEVPTKAEYRIVLSDGTVVTLNAGSKLKYPIKFQQNERKVEISGEAFFEVAHETNRPFRVIDIYGNQIEVKGTCFNMRAYPDEIKSKVALVEGSVVFSSSNKEQIELTPGYEISYNAKSLLCECNPINKNEVTAWKKGRFVFDNRELEYIFSCISRWYGIQLTFEDDTVKKMHFSLDVPKYENLSVLTDIFQSTGSLHFQQDGNNITVSCTF